MPRIFSLGPDRDMTTVELTPETYSVLNKMRTNFSISPSGPQAPGP